MGDADPILRGTDLEVPGVRGRGVPPSERGAQRERGGAAGAVASTAPILELESIRGLAALLVVVYHIPKWNALLDTGVINNGYLMVDLFFVLSGFVIYRAYSERIQTSRDLFRFQLLRFGRIYPVHLLILLTFLLLETVRYVGYTKFGAGHIRVVPFSDNNALAFIQHLLLVQAVIPHANAATFNSPAWSISTEFYTYLLFGLTALWFGRRSVVAAALLFGAALSMLTTGTTLGLEDLLRCLAGFFLGCVTAHLSREAWLAPSRPLSAIIFAAMLIFLQLKPEKAMDYPIYFFAPALILSLVHRRDGILNAVLRTGVLARIGTLSYSIYMSHGLVIWCVATVFKRLLRRPESINDSGLYVLNLTAFETMVGTATVLGITFAVSHLIYATIEGPSREKVRRLADAGPGCLRLGRSFPDDCRLE